MQLTTLGDWKFDALRGRFLVWVSNPHNQFPVRFYYIIHYPERKDLQMNSHGFIQRITFSPTLLKLYLLAIDNTSPEELADVTLSWIMGFAADAFLTFLQGGIHPPVNRCAAERRGMKHTKPSRCPWRLTSVTLTSSAGRPFSSTAVSPTSCAIHFPSVPTSDVKEYAQQGRLSLSSKRCSSIPHIAHPGLPGPWTSFHNLGRPQWQLAR